jgi:hypothetical protein
MPLYDPSSFGAISKLATQRPRFVTGGHSYWRFWALNKQYEIPDCVEIGRNHPSATVDINAVSPSTNLPPLHDCLLECLIPDAAAKFLTSTLVIMANLGANVNTLVPLAAIPPLRRVAKLDPDGKRGVPALIIALACGMADKLVLEKLWKLSKDPKDTVVPAWLAAALAPTNRRECMRFVIQKWDELDPIRHFNLVSPHSDGLWVRTSCLLECFRTSDISIMMLLAEKCTNELIEEHKDDLAADLLAPTAKGSTLLHDLCMAQRLDGSESSFQKFINVILGALKDRVYIKDKLGRFPLELWLSSGRRYSQHWHLPPELYVKLRFLPRDDPYRMKHSHIDNILSLLVSDPENPLLSFVRALDAFAKEQGEQFVTDLLENLATSIDCFTLWYLLCGCPVSLTHFDGTKVSSHRAMLAFKPHQLRPALTRLMATGKASPRFSYVCVAFAAAGLEETKTPEYMHFVLSGTEVNATQLSLLLQCGCPATHPNLVPLLVKSQMFDCLSMLIQNGAPLSGLSITSFLLPTHAVTFAPYRDMILTLLRAGIDPNEPDADGRTPIQNLLSLVSDGGSGDTKGEVVLFETIAHLVRAGATVQEPEKLAFLGFRARLAISHLLVLLDAIPKCAIDERGLWSEILTAPPRHYSDLELGLICDKLEEIRLNFHFGDSSIGFTRLPIFGKVLSIAASPHYFGTPERHKELVQLAKNCIWACLADASDKKQRDKFLADVAAFDYLKDGQRTMLVDDPYFQMMLIENCKSVWDAVLLAAHGILLQPGVERFAKDHNVTDLEEKIRIQKEAQNPVPKFQSNPFGSSNLFSSNVPDTGIFAPSTFSSPATPSSPFSGFGIPSSGTSVSFGVSTEAPTISPFSAFTSPVAPAPAPLGDSPFGAVPAGETFGLPAGSRRAMAKKSSGRKK